MRKFPPATAHLIGPRFKKKKAAQVAAVNVSAANGGLSVAVFGNRRDGFTLAWTAGGPPAFWIKSEQES